MYSSDSRMKHVEDEKRCAWKTYLKLLPFSQKAVELLHGKVYTVGSACNRLIGLTDMKH